MGGVKIYDNKVHEAMTAAKELEESIKRTYDSSKRLITFMHTAKWSGKSRDAFLSYLEIIHEYHKDLKKAVGKQTKALNNIDGYLNDFLQDGSVRKVRNL